MNKLSASNIAQLCSRVATIELMIVLGNKVRRKESFIEIEMEGLIERIQRRVLTQIPLSLLLPKTKKLQQEWFVLVNSETRRCVLDAMDTFMLATGLPGIISKIYDGHKKV